MFGFKNTAIRASKKAGFTLVEMLMVLSMIGAISSNVIPNMTSVRDRAQDIVRVSDIKQLALAMELTYDQRKGRYTTLVNTTPQAIGTEYPEVPENNTVNDGIYGWLDNTGEPTRYCAWATLAQERFGGRFFVASEIGAGFFEDAPTDFDDCVYYEEQNGENGLESGSDKKVQICYLTKKNQYKTLNIGFPALPAHVASGAIPGPCPD